MNVRLLCATHRDLQQQVALGNFRQDLFFRLYIFPIEIPALRERPEDILPLAENFLKEFSPDGKGKSLTSEAQKKLRQYRWPGNVRELKNAMQRAMILSPANTVEADTILLTDLQPIENKTTVGVQSLEAYERQAIIDALKHCRGKQSKTAARLGISRSTLYNKIQKFRITDDDWY